MKQPTVQSGETTLLGRNAYSTDYTWSGNWDWQESLLVRIKERDYVGNYKLSPFGESMEKEMTEKQSPTSMHDLLTNRERMRNKWRALARIGMSKRPQPVTEPSSTFRIDLTVEELEQRKRDISDGSIPF